MKHKHIWKNIKQTHLLWFDKRMGCSFDNYTAWAEKYVCFKCGLAKYIILNDESNIWKKKNLKHYKSNLKVRPKSLKD